MIDSHRIQFEKPDLDSLTRQFTVVDLHFHSKYSDGANSIHQIARRAEALGIGIAITDHNEIKGALEMDRHRDILSIPGIEVTSVEGTHVVVYFYDTKDLAAYYREEILPYLGHDIMSSTGLEMEAIIESARRFEAIVIFPHPNSAAYTGVVNPYFPEERLRRLFEMADGVEVINSSNLNIWNLQSALLGFNLDKTVTGGSDGHSLKYMGKVVTIADCDRQRRVFLDALREKRNKVIGKEIDLFRKVTTNGFKFRSNLKNTPDLVEKNIRYSYTYLQSKSRRLIEKLDEVFLVK